jgi:hypothetical protein
MDWKPSYKYQQSPQLLVEKCPKAGNSWENILEVLKYHCIIVEIL